MDNYTFHWNFIESNIHTFYQIMLLFRVMQKRIRKILNLTLLSPPLSKGSIQLIQAECITAYVAVIHFVELYSDCELNKKESCWVDLPGSFTSVLVRPFSWKSYLPFTIKPQRQNQTKPIIFDNKGKTSLTK